MRVGISWLGTLEHRFRVQWSLLPILYVYVSDTQFQNLNTFPDRRAWLTGGFLGFHSSGLCFGFGSVWVSAFDGMP